jgi:glycosyltransferase involved in cell wall biosynthesis
LLGLNSRRYLVFANFSQPVFNNNLASLPHALKKTGEVKAVDLYPHCKGQAAADAALAIPADVFGDAVTAFDPDVIICFGGGWHIPNSQKPPNSRALYLGFALSDPAGFEASCQVAACCDLFFTNDPESLSDYYSRGLTARHFITAVEPELFEIPSYHEKNVDMIYIGRHTPAREELLVRLSSDFSIHVHAHRGELQRWKLPAYPPLESCRDFADTASRAWFGMDYPRPDYLPGRGHYRLHDRVLFYMASRCVAVMPHFSGLEQLFIPGQELVSFSTLRELSQKLSDLKQDGQRYETMLGCAYTKLLEEFSW